MADQSSTRLSINLNRDAAASLRYLADLNDKSFTLTVHEAIALLKFITDERKADRKILTTNQYGEDARELVWP